MQYSQEVIEHFKNPHNQGQIAKADAVSEVGNPLCGDIMKIYLKIDKSDSADRLSDTIADIKFETLGCAAAIACSSISTDMAKGKTLAEAWDLRKSEIVEGLGTLPPIKIHCSVLSSDGLKVAIQNYLAKQGVLDQYPEIKAFKVKEF
ncbi:MAG: iron-sulfur cluster assembly scaffold protein [Patescibacteria group bacterium]|jgi:nitrogen fixation NifU-like protein|nr:iron-sulfur cluster assembly scaffold protein [Patescibacteria group bacterium]